MDSSSRQSISFAKLFEAELESLKKGTGKEVTDRDIAIDEDNAEPRVRFAAEPLVGLALSGGGIRSATFGLGLLTGLDYFRILKFVDYVSTVSGGGYIGGWLSAWYARSGAETLRLPPRHDAPEAPAVRHLREFSQFLVPRVGIVEMDLWEGVISVVGGILVSVSAATLVLSAGLGVWLLFLAGTWAKSKGNWLGPTSIGLATFGFLGLYEAAWRRWKRETLEVKRVAATLLCYAALSAAVAVLWVYGASAIMSFVAKKELGEFTTPNEGDKATAWLKNPAAMPLWIAPAIVWLVVALVLLFVRFVTSRWAAVGRVAEWRKVFDLVTARLLILGATWSVLAVIWWLGRYYFTQLSVFAGMFVGVLTGGGGLTLIITLLQRWFARAPSQVQADRLTPKLRSLLVQWLAYALVLFGGASLASIVVIWLMDDMMGLIALGSAVIKVDLSNGQKLTIALLGFVFVDSCLLLVVALLYDPEKMGLHPFYRDRIVRAYLGASNRSAGKHQVEVAAGDDLPLTGLKGRPIHLVCCAANGLTDDPLATLDRGCRSAVASQVGFCIGDSAVRWDPTGKDVPLLGSFLTASAAALNPMMGSVSKRLGRAVTFLLAAFNVRLGLWVAAPSSGGPTLKKRRLFVGWLFFREMFGLSSCRETESQQLAPRPNFVHLSDGGHFENTAVYELVRRHCRYIIVSDAGADPDVAFDDFGNAIRRIREDFGVEIEIDLEPLKPGPDRRAKQHMVVGTIHYDAERADQGTLLYFKPSLTGDEPYDVYQYSVRNTQFPHESTGDQFYDEAQWEAYRRLGEHVVRSSLSFYDSKPEQKRRGTRDESDDARNRVDNLFASVRTYWYPTPPDFHKNFSRLTQQYAEFEGELRKAASSTLVVEIFPELASLRDSAHPESKDEARPTQRNDKKPESSQTSQQAGEAMRFGAADKSGTEQLADATTSTHEASQLEWEKTLHLLLQMIQLMEDVWVNASLDTHASHPLNGGWINLFMRWASTPSFQLWWPILKPLYGIGFREWIDDQIDNLRLRPSSFHPKPLDHVSLTVDPKSPEAVSSEGFRRVPTCEPLPSGGYLYTITLEQGSRSLEIQAAEVFYSRVENVAYWNSDDFNVSAGLWGTGNSSGFLKSVLENLMEQGVTACHVLLPAFNVADPNSRLARTDLITFYSKYGFRASQSIEDIPKEFRPQPNERAKFESVLVRKAVRFPTHA